MTIFISKSSNLTAIFVKKTWCFFQNISSTTLFLMNTAHKPPLSWQFICSQAPKFQNPGHTYLPGKKVERLGEGSRKTLTNVRLYEMYFKHSSVVANLIATFSSHCYQKTKVNLMKFFKLFFFFFFFMSSRCVKFGSLTTLFSMKYGTWFMDEQGTRQNTELKKSCTKCFIVSVMSFHVYFDKQVH